MAGTPQIFTLVAITKDRLYHFLKLKMVIASADSLLTLGLLTIILEILVKPSYLTCLAVANSILFLGLKFLPEKIWALTFCLQWIAIYLS